MALNTEGLPKLDSGPLVRNVAQQLDTGFSQVSDRAGTIKSTWAPIGNSYDAPEASLVITAMDVPDTEATSLVGKGETVQSALNTYADKLEELQTRKTTLIADIDEFNERKAEVQAENEDNNVLDDLGDWWNNEDVDLMHEEEDLSARASQLQADKDAAERECANAIGAIWGAPTYEAAGETDVWDETVYGTTAENYDQLVLSGDAPWGHPSMWSEGDWTTKVEQIGEGMWGSITGTVDFLGDLVGVDGGGQASAAWSGLGQLGFDVVRGGGGLVGTVWSQFDPEGVAESQERLLETGKGIIGWDTWDTSGWQTGGGLGLDVILGVATGGAGFAAKAGIKAALKGARAGARVPGSSTTASSLSSALRQGLRDGVDGSIRGLDDWLQNSRQALHNLLPDRTPEGPDRGPDGDVPPARDGGGEQPPVRSDADQQEYGTSSPAQNPDGVTANGYRIPEMTADASSRLDSLADTPGSGVVRNADGTYQLSEPIRVDDFTVNQPHHSRAEFDRQLGMQQQGLNELSVDEWLHNRDYYDTHGRTGSQTAERTRLAGEGVDLDGRDVLHGPDQVAGGRRDSFTGSGDSGVNQAIGSEWRTRVGGLDDAVADAIEGIDPSLLPYLRMNVELSVG